VAIGKPPRKGRFLAGKILELNGDFSFAMFDWLVVSTPLKNIGQLGLFFPIYGKTIIKKTPTSFQDSLRILYSPVSLHSNTAVESRLIGSACVLVLQSLIHKKKGCVRKRSLEL
jgi:hypothetical protein